LQEFHDGPTGGHFGGDTTMQKIIHVGYYWPTMFKTVMSMCENENYVKQLLEDKGNHHFLYNQSTLNNLLNNGYWML